MNRIRATTILGYSFFLASSCLVALQTEKPKPDLGPNADMRGSRPFLDDNPWNQPVDKQPIDPNSNQIIASIGLDKSLNPNFGAKWNGGPFGILYIVVSGSQAKVPMQFQYRDESDPEVRTFRRGCERVRRPAYHRNRPRQRGVL